MKIGIDFDGVIRERFGIPRPKDFREDGKPMNGVAEAITWMIEKGHEPYVFSNRNEPKKMRKWMLKHEIPELRITNVKQSGTAIYLDDRACRFTSWMDFCKFLG